MPNSLFEKDFRDVIKRAADARGSAKAPFHSPEDWRDQWIYFLMVDRFNNVSKRPQPESLRFDDPDFAEFLTLPAYELLP